MNLHLGIFSNEETYNPDSHMTRTKTSKPASVQINIILKSHSNYPIIYNYVQLTHLGTLFSFYFFENTWVRITRFNQVSRIALEATQNLLLLVVWFDIIFPLAGPSKVSIYSLNFFVQ